MSCHRRVDNFPLKVFIEMANLLLLSSSLFMMATTRWMVKMREKEIFVFNFMIFSDGRLYINVTARSRLEIDLKAVVGP